MFVVPAPDSARRTKLVPASTQFLISVKNCSTPIEQHSAGESGSKGGCAAIKRLAAATPSSLSVPNSVGQAERLVAGRSVRAVNLAM